MAGQHNVRCKLLGLRTHRREGCETCADNFYLPSYRHPFFPNIGIVVCCIGLIIAFQWYKIDGQDPTLSKTSANPRALQLASLYCRRILAPVRCIRSCGRCILENNVRYLRRDTTRVL